MRSVFLFLLSPFPWGLFFFCFILLVPFLLFNSLCLLSWLPSLVYFFFVLWLAPLCVRLSLFFLHFLSFDFISAPLLLFSKLPFSLFSALCFVFSHSPRSSHFSGPEEKPNPWWPGSWIERSCEGIGSQRSASLYLGEELRWTRLCWTRDGPLSRIQHSSSQGMPSLVFLPSLPFHSSFSFVSMLCCSSMKPRLWESGLVCVKSTARVNHEKWSTALVLSWRSGEKLRRHSNSWRTTSRKNPNSDLLPVFEAAQLSSMHASGNSSSGHHCGSILVGHFCSFDAQHKVVCEWGFASWDLFSFLAFFLFRIRETETKTEHGERIDQTNSSRCAGPLFKFNNAIRVWCHLQSLVRQSIWIWRSSEPGTRPRPNQVLVLWPPQNLSRVSSQRVPLHRTGWLCCDQITNGCDWCSILWLLFGIGKGARKLLLHGIFFYRLAYLTFLTLQLEQFIAVDVRNGKILKIEDHWFLPLLYLCHLVLVLGLLLFVSSPLPVQVSS